ncbi:sugar ABC transporter permease [Faecalicatena sp. Marseille-Q4148]|nr:sugar ABC transporter permease [Faecalicatena sp. Marseille-Q4148]
MYPQKKYFVLMLAPIIIWFVFAILMPIVGAFRYSFYEWSGGPKEFIGLGNYETLLHDEVFWLALKNNLIIVVISVIGQIGVALILATLMTSRVLKFKTFHRTVIFFPVLLSAVVVGFVWTLMYNKDYGFLNAILKAVGLENLIFPYLDDPKRVLYSLIAPLIWQFIGLYMVIISSGIANVDNEVFEVAEIDGAVGWKKLFYITLPLIKPTLMASLMMCISGNMKVFSHIQVMTNGGPGNSSMVMALYAYKRSFAMNEIGYGSAISIAILIISLILVGITRLLFARKED